MGIVAVIIIGLIGVALSIGLVYYFARKGEKTVECMYQGHNISVTIKSNFIYVYLDGTLVDSNSSLGPNYNLTFHQPLGDDEIRVEVTNYKVSIYVNDQKQELSK
ncbi:MAG: hypothetical protein IKQ31_02185 [Clostridia bacterium]|nr:hypothetical protein [Clostridia bacterium]